MAEIDYKNYGSQPSRSTPPAEFKPAGRPQAGTEGPAFPRPQQGSRLGRFSKCLLALLLLLAFSFGALEGFGWWVAHRAAAVVETEPEGKKPKTVQALQNENAALRKKIAALAPKGLFVVVDTASNRVYLRQGDQTLREMVASCGSGTVLEDQIGGRTWTFETPRGTFKIQSKVKNPVWIKPDWAFLEEGESVPKNWSERAEPGMMGDYALGIGKGYFIHGTMYSRLLGRNVSHGCIRLGDDDLKNLVDQVALGTPVIIF
jgi:L,D-transpeptidase YbiS